MKSFFKKIIVAVLTWEARLVLKKYKPDIIAVTGSVGKTSTKDAIYTLISPSVHVRKSDKSFNSEIGLPLTILGCANAWNDPLAWLGNIARGLSLIMYRAEYPKCLVLEVGADHPGDIKRLARWFHPDITVITAVSKVPVHVEFFSSPKAVLEEKLALATAIKPHGKLVLPANDPDILAVRAEPVLAGATTVTFGVHADADVSAGAVTILYEERAAEKGGENGGRSLRKPVGMSFELKYAGNSVPVALRGVVGFQHVYSMVAASAAALAYGISLETIAAAIPAHRSPRGRMNVLNGLEGSIIIDDSYNASPDAVKEALAVLCDVAGTRKIAVLGDMMELGAYSLDEHKKAGTIAARALMTGLDSPDAVIVPQAHENLLITVGIRARDIGEGALAAGMSRESIHSFETSAEAAEHVRSILRANDVILVKGSQSPRMERVSRAILAHADGSPADDAVAAELLVRQEPEWLARA